MKNKLNFVQKNVFFLPMLSTYHSTTTAKSGNLSTPGGTRESDNRLVIVTTAAAVRILKAPTSILKLYGLGVDTEVATLFASEDWNDGESGGKVLPGTSNLHHHRQAADQSVVGNELTREDKTAERASEATHWKRKRSKATIERRKDAAEIAEGTSVKAALLWWRRGKA